ncbi:class I SAM-dependent methyltransferase [Marinibactrum halimedae]|uniref:Methyltransferase type 11 domain-containing protein n=1 Tax=Marinibactrum halimedae TaxID=1444977 RepID=A0AA37T4K0_9GAMM|nr:class I SAM-dependent methyltransferase [Marinibactrum halimedae]MCD9461078.1 class I SAM-dependent methyltransferase [Marinibactrum halimedae]GLS26745.1 hypothetical protein GCM10007877_24630 [Marinibactrum halimedae]
MSSKMDSAIQQSSTQRLMQWWSDQFGAIDLVKTVPDVERWFESPLGQQLLQAEQQVIDESLNCLFGYHLLQLSVHRQARLFGASMINHCFGLHPMDASSTNNAIIHSQSSFERLPFANDTVDVAVLHHVLDFAIEPHKLLREVSRVVIPHGYVLIVGFNPVSLLGVGRQLSNLVSRKPLYRANTIRLRRLMDWLRLLDFEPVKTQRGLFVPPINHKSSLQKLQWVEALAKKIYWPLGGFYAVVARKHVGAVTPIKPSWTSINPLQVIPGKVASRVPEACREAVGQRPSLYLVDDYRVDNLGSEGASQPTKLKE